MAENIRKIRGIRRLTSGSYQIRWINLSGNACSYVVDDPEVAEKTREEIKRLKRQGINWQPPEFREPATIREVFEKFLIEKKDDSSCSTTDTYAVAGDVFDKFLKERYRPPFSANILSRQLLLEYREWLRLPGRNKNGDKLALSTVKKYIRQLEGVWKWARNSEIWPDDIPEPRYLDFSRLPRPAKKIPMRQEMDACISFLTGEHKAFAIFLRMTGMRPMESALINPRTDIDWAMRTIEIRAENEKTGTGRIVPVSNWVYNWLKKRCSENIGPKLFYVTILEKPSGKKEVFRKPFTEAWRKAIAAGLVRPTLQGIAPLKSFRGGFKSMMLGLGADSDAVDYLQGHTLGDLKNARADYLDPLIATPLRSIVELIPAIQDKFDDNVLPVLPFYDQKTNFGS